MQLLPGGAAELPALSNPHSRRPLLNGALSRANGCKYEDFVIVSEKSKDPNVARLLCSHERFGLQAVGMISVNTASIVVYLDGGCQASITRKPM